MFLLVIHQLSTWDPTDLEQTNWVQCEIQIRDERVDQLGWRAEHPERTVKPDQRLRCGQDRC